jgi:hypothetical protein
LLDRRAFYRRCRKRQTILLLIGSFFAGVFCHNSSDPDIHNELVGGAHYEETVAGIRNAVTAGINLSINTPLCSLNKDYLETLKLIYINHL